MKADIFISGLSSPEGPVQLPNGDFLVVEMGQDAGSVSYVHSTAKKIERIAKTGRPNGLAMDYRKTIWTAESMHPSLVKVSFEGKVEIILENCEGNPFMFPNDLAFGPDGKLYMTDSGIFYRDFVINGSIRSDFATAPYDGKVYCIDTSTLDIYTIDDGIHFANGIAFGPDGLLYVNETITGNIYRYRRINGRFDRKTRETFGNVIRDDGLVYYRGPDGMKFSSAGNLYCTVYGQGDVTVLDRNGSVIRRLETLGKCPTNLVFGLPGTNSIYVTEVSKGALERHFTGEDGLPLHMGLA